MNKPSSYEFIGARVFSDIRVNSNGSDMMYTMNHLYHGIFGSSLKSIHNTNMVLNAKHHFDVGCVNPDQCEWHRVNISDGYFLHYRINMK